MAMQKKEKALPILLEEWGYNFSKYSRILFFAIAITHMH